MKRFKDYDDAVSYILQIPRFSAKNDMDATKAFLNIIGEAKADTVIHVAGTNGKGSTCAFLNSVYIEQNKINDKNILFIHTGGTPLFFDAMNKMSR